MSLSNKLNSGTIETPTMASQLASEGWYCIPTGPTGKPTTTDINRAREAAARLMGWLPMNSAMVNVPVYEKAALEGKYGIAWKAVWMALNLALNVAEESSGDSALSEWKG